MSVLFHYSGAIWRIIENYCDHIDNALRCEKYRKMGQEVSDRYQNLIDWSLGHDQGSEQNRSVANVQSDDLWPSRMHAATHILQEKTHACGVLKGNNFQVHVSLGSAETLVRSLGGIINHRSIAYSLGNISAKNYRNRLMWVESIVCNISVVFWDAV